MKLYHGTSIKHLPLILKEGLKPRGKKGTNNWTHTIGSNPKSIYLTNAYAIYFAHNAAEIGEDCVVVEIDTAKLNPLKLVPDEDFLEQATRKGNGPAPIDKSMRYRTAWYRRRLLGFQQYWRDSIDGMGTCGYLGEIPLSALTRYAIIPDDRRAEIIMNGMDPFITTINYRLCGDRYRNWCRWVFNDPLEQAPYDPDQVHPDHPKLVASFDPAYMRKINRGGDNSGGNPMKFKMEIQFELREDDLNVAETEELMDFVIDALQAWGGQRHPDDWLFDSLENVKIEKLRKVR